MDYIAINVMCLVFPLRQVSHIYNLKTIVLSLVHSKLIL